MNTAPGLRLWVLGASDPEMEDIEALLKRSGEAYAYALLDGRRVDPDTARKANSFRLVGGHVKDSIYSYQRLMVECRLDMHWGTNHDLVFDHHTEGDPGFGLGPGRFLEASAIGQVLLHMHGLHAPHQRLGYVWVPKGKPGPYWSIEPWDGQGEVIEVPESIVLTAAADHCLVAAYRGLCPGVEPEDLARWRIMRRASFQKRSVSSLMADVQHAAQELKGAPKIQMGNEMVADMRGSGYIAELPEAAVQSGLPFLSAGLRGEDGRSKYILGAAAPETVEAFLKEWAPNFGLVDSYGCGQRGFAGAYRRDDGKTKA